MAIVYKCDKCGKLYGGSEPEKSLRIDLRPQEKDKCLRPYFMDLCPECADAFEDFIGKKIELEEF